VGFSVRSSSRKKGRLSDYTDADMRIWFMDFIPGRKKIKGGCMTRQRGPLELAVNDAPTSKKG
jgi:hypothetical protein